MNFADAEKIAAAVLYEGYILYPYRPSAVKNAQRWNFGTLYPQAYAEAQRPAESFRIKTECLVKTDGNARLDVRARFLHLVRKHTSGSKDWDEGIDRSHELKDLGLIDLSITPMVHDFSVPAGQSDTKKAATLSGRLIVEATLAQPGLYRLSLQLLNHTPMQHAAECPRDEAMLQAFVSAHLLLGVENGEFISLLDMPEEYREAVAGCNNSGVFPVLVGSEGQRSMLFCSPIILYDYPKIAPESAGDFFDGTEMDEMLALRVLTLTEEEKSEIRGGDARAQQILERTEGLPQDFLMKVHGAVRGLRPVTEIPPEEFEIGNWDPLAETPSLDTVRVLGIDLRVGDRVRLWPQKTADIMDMALKGKVALIEAIEQDFEDNVQLAVVLDDDPGREFGMMRQPGHRFFFSPEEVEPFVSETTPENA
jgi:hypothetical protein